MAAKNFELFLGCLGNGVTVCNSAVIENGDFKMVSACRCSHKHPGLRRAGAGKVRDMAQRPVSGRAPGVRA